MGGHLALDHSNTLLLYRVKWGHETRTVTSDPTDEESNSGEIRPGFWALLGTAVVRL
jgi:hypothetical protein